ncbi:hypothetical protein JOC37_001176 [Desulfohalotomaculum tongense]|uniref:hypothetical protein n=1 Tax=Desulforadius tongensis TaxID=1216062 RepID=UPI001EE630E9|nr:hypothetical protein [Desulforadius tongensis]MBM7854798.1 hypothetical protein [Desulforadius tongensis]
MGNAAEQGAIEILTGLVARQSFMNALDDTFVVSAIIISFVLPLTFMLSKKRVEKERQRQEQLYVPRQQPLRHHR